MNAVPQVRLALFLLCPLVAWPGLGYDGLRLPTGLALAGTLALGPRRAPGLLLAAFAGFVVLQALSVVPGGFSGVLTASLGLAGYWAARSCPDRRFVPWVLSGLAASLGVAAAFGREGLEGNPNYAGAVAGLLVPPLAALAGEERGRLRAAALAGLAGAAFALLASESRAGLLAACAGSGLVAVLALRRSGRRAAAVPAAAAILLIALPLAFRPARFVSAERLETASVRTEIWKGAWRLALDRPWRGTGAGGFAAEFPPYRSPKEAAITYRDARPGEYREVEDAHSTWLQVLAENGFPGLLALIATLGFAARAVVRGAIAGTLESGLAGLAVAFLVAASFNTLHLHVSPWILFWAAVGLLEGPAPEAAGWKSSAHFGLAALAIPALFSGSWIRTERALIEASALSDPEARLRRLDGVREGKGRAEYLRGGALLALGRFGEAADRFDRVAVLRPHHGGAWVNSGVARLRAGAPRAQVRELFLKAKSADPTYFGADFNLGNLAAMDGRWSEARERYRAAQALHPGHAGSAYGEGAAWLAEGKVEEALPALRRARELGMDVDAALKADFPALSADPRLR